ncbi:OmpA family protein [Thermonema rossianum]|uniref:OmpA family protein n=1 Tax=Thermonema rossianum TaxID=55505 RepID=UPI00068CD9EA|nr:OmpA family protein [Thermonema rossianum]
MRLSYILYITISFILITQISGMAQNLVPDGSFEQYLDCPHDYGTVRLGILRHWRATPGDCTPDYFHHCGKNDFSTEKNTCGGLPPQDGHGYAGLIIRTGEGKNQADLYYREAIQTELSEVLRPNARYIVRFYVARSVYSAYAAGNIGVLLTPHPIEISALKDYPAQVKHPEIITSTEWVKIEDTIVARGGERYLTIGEFERYENRKILPLSVPAKYSKRFSYPRAYYFIDKVSVEFLDEPNASREVVLTREAPSSYIVSHDFGDIQPGKPVVLQGIKFEYNQAELLPQSEVTLKKLYRLLLLHPQIKIIIVGHTDEKGTAEYNQLLSEERARRVAMYLINKGISPERIRFKGKGASEPLNTADTPEAHEENRRVEFIIEP